MQKWEYKYVELEGRTWVDSVTREVFSKWADDRIPMLNALGDAGWELAAEVNTMAVCTLTFKRPRQ